MDVLQDVNAALVERRQKIAGRGRTRDAACAEGIEETSSLRALQVWQAGAATQGKYARASTWSDS